LQKKTNPQGKESKNSQKSEFGFLPAHQAGDSSGLYHQNDGVWFDDSIESQNSALRTPIFFSINLKKKVVGRRTEAKATATP